MRLSASKFTPGGRVYLPEQTEYRLLQAVGGQAKAVKPVFTLLPKACKWRAVKHKSRCSAPDGRPGLEYNRQIPAARRRQLARAHLSANDRPRSGS